MDSMHNNQLSLGRTTPARVGYHSSDGLLGLCFGLCYTLRHERAMRTQSLSRYACLHVPLHASGLYINIVSTALLVCVHRYAHLHANLQ
eukprot:COSAG03_NODE_1503_length_3972_cov_14.924864_2_plen_89_part_00